MWIHYIVLCMCAHVGVLFYLFKHLMPSCCFYSVSNPHEHGWAQLILTYNICSFSRQILRMQLCRQVIHEKPLKDTQLQDNLFKHGTSLSINLQMILIWLKEFIRSSNTLILNWYLHALYWKIKQNDKDHSKINTLQLESKNNFDLIWCHLKVRCTTC